MSDDQEFFAGDAESSDTIPVAYSSIKKGSNCMVKGFPCRVIEYSTAKPGKHGSSKVTVVGLDIFTNKKYEDTAPTSANARVPIIKKIQCEVAAIDNNNLVSLILNDGSLKNDLKLPVDDEDLYLELKKIWDDREDKTVYFSYIAACGKQKLISARKKE